MFAADENSLLNVFEAIDVIDWSRDHFVVYHSHPNETPSSVIINYIKNKGNQSHFVTTPLNQHVMLTNNCALLRMPDGVYVKSLERCHAQIAHDTHKNRANHSAEDVADEIDQMPSAGVFLKHNDQLVSWIVYNPPFGMSRLFTLEEYRRKGYAKLAVQYMAKRVAQTGYLPTVNINVDNEVSAAFFENLGYKWLRTVDLIVSAL